MHCWKRLACFFVWTPCALVPAFRAQETTCCIIELAKGAVWTAGIWTWHAYLLLAGLSTISTPIIWSVVLLKGTGMSLRWIIHHGISVNASISSTGSAMLHNRITGPSCLTCKYLRYATYKGELYGDWMYCNIYRRTVHAVSIYYQFGGCHMFSPLRWKLSQRCCHYRAGVSNYHLIRNKNRRRNTCYAQEIQ